MTILWFKVITNTSKEPQMTLNLSSILMFHSKYEVNFGDCIVDFFDTINVMFGEIKLVSLELKNMKKIRIEKLF